MTSSCWTRWNIFWSGLRFSSGGPQLWLLMTVVWFFFGLKCTWQGRDLPRPRKCLYKLSVTRSPYLIYINALLLVGKTDDLNGVVNEKLNKRHFFGKSRQITRFSSQNRTEKMQLILPETLIPTNREFRENAKIKTLRILLKLSNINKSEIKFKKNRNWPNYTGSRPIGTSHIWICWFLNSKFESYSMSCYRLASYRHTLNDLWWKNKAIFLAKSILITYELFFVFTKT